MLGLGLQPDLTLGKHWKSSTKLSRNHIKYPEQLITKACVHVSLTAVRVNSWSKPALSLSPAFSPSPLSPVGHAMLQPALLQPVVCLIGTAAITDTDCVCLLSAVCCLPLRRETEWPGRDGSSYCGWSTQLARRAHQVIWYIRIYADRTMATALRDETRPQIWLTILTWSTVLIMVGGEIFTSSLKVERLVQEERTVLDELKQYIDHQYDRLKDLSSFYTDRVKELNLQDSSKTPEVLQHPNAVYKAIKRFSSDYALALGENLESFRRTVATAQVPFEADHGDIRGATLSLLRLQSVYQLKAVDMAQGDYLGYRGPPLSPIDTFELGQLAFSESRLNDSLDWLNVTLSLLSHFSAKASSHLSPAHVKALMGRVHLYGGNDYMAQGLYDEVKFTDPSGGDTLELSKELLDRPRALLPKQQDYFQNFSRLCSLDNVLHVPNPAHPTMVCRYREALLPYYLFKEEILSEQPFASVIYNLTSDIEADTLKNHVKNQLVRGRVGDTATSFVSDIRTSDLSWVWDSESSTAANISLRIKHLTGLETNQDPSAGPASTEAFQVVNYGLGGHYEVHVDPFEDDATIEQVMENSGNRIATVLLYLSDVTRGGSTVFTKAGMAVAPVKNMALFWYNFRPDHQLDYLTYHAGCPVVIGHKWIANKWIWTAGNTFRRRCALSPQASQLDIERDMRKSYRPLEPR
ncbi:hypothetical protein RRG08_008745 [Elysia crispata]|uniref:procollagen-proline 4-dioxygenase n=1 Tax=Elysia crispata TaxID=231223 RepID=A0AAE0YU94_9GAST|nr:hypothetical protein RRG08_008745 [Elysia crispata]